MLLDISYSSTQPDPRYAVIYVYSGARRYSSLLLSYPMLIKMTETGTSLYFPVWVTKPRLLRLVVVPVKREAKISLRPSLPTVTMLFATARSNARVY